MQSPRLIKSTPTALSCPRLQCLSGKLSLMNGSYLCDSCEWVGPAEEYDRLDSRSLAAKTRSEVLAIMAEEARRGQKGSSSSKSARKDDGLAIMGRERRYYEDDEIISRRIAGANGGKYSQIQVRGMSAEDIKASIDRVVAEAEEERLMTAEWVAEMKTEFDTSRRTSILRRELLGTEEEWKAAEISMQFYPAKDVKLQCVSDES